MSSPLLAYKTPHRFGSHPQTNRDGPNRPTRRTDLPTYRPTDRRTNVGSLTSNISRLRLERFSFQKAFCPPASRVIGCRQPAISRQLPQHLPTTPWSNDSRGHTAGAPHPLLSNSSILNPNPTTRTHSLTRESKRRPNFLYSPSLILSSTGQLSLSLSLSLSESTSSKD